jgi:glucose-6-phosphate isomerase
MTKYTHRKNDKITTHRINNKMTLTKEQKHILYTIIHNRKKKKFPINTTTKIDNLFEYIPDKFQQHQMESFIFNILGTKGYNLRLNFSKDVKTIDVNIFAFALDD